MIAEVPRKEIPCKMNFTDHPLKGNKQDWGLI